MQTICKIPNFLFLCANDIFLYSEWPEEFYLDRRPSEMRLVRQSKCVASHRITWMTVVNLRVDHWFRCEYPSVLISVQSLFGWIDNAFTPIPYMPWTNDQRLKLLEAKRDLLQHPGLRFPILPLNQCRQTNQSPFPESVPKNHPPSYPYLER